MLFLVTVATSIQIQFFGEYILRDQACTLWGEIHYFNIALLWGNNPDSQLNKLNFLDISTGILPIGATWKRFPCFLSW